jgi:histidine triad (HIT) family protein
MQDQDIDPNCLFCKIARDEATVLWQDAEFAAFKDIHPKAPLHVLVVPKRHVATFDDIPAEMAAGYLAAIQAVARQQGVAGAYKLAVNVGEKGGQEIDHVHFHLLARP